MRGCHRSAPACSCQHTEVAGDSWHAAETRNLRCTTAVPPDNRILVRLHARLYTPQPEPRERSIASIHRNFLCLRFWLIRWFLTERRGNREPPPRWERAQSSGPVHHAALHCLSKEPRSSLRSLPGSCAGARRGWEGAADPEMINYTTASVIHRKS